MKIPPPIPFQQALQALVEAAVQNATDLIAESDRLVETRSWARVHFLASTALEELAKAQLVSDVKVGDLSAEYLQKALTSHRSKYSFLKEPVLDSAASSSAREFAASATRLREAALYVGVTASGELLLPSRAITEQQAQHTLLAAHKTLSAVNLLTLQPDGLATKNARAFGAALSKTGA